MVKKKQNYYMGGGFWDTLYTHGFAKALVAQLFGIIVGEQKAETFANRSETPKNLTFIKNTEGLVAVFNCQLSNFQVLNPELH